MSARILVVEDDRTLRETLADALALEGYEVVTAEDGERGVELAFARHFDLLVLDWMLPGRSGLEILREVREAKLAVPVLLLTVRGDEEDKVFGFEVGADDYVTKPFSLRELLVRIKALLRRSAPRRAATGTRERFRIGDAEVDLAGFRLLRDGEEITLSPREVAVLRLLCEEEGRVVSRNRFIDAIWGEEAEVTTRTIDMHVLHLRQKLERDPKAPVHLLTVHGAGYRLVVEPPVGGAGG